MHELERNVQNFIKKHNMFQKDTPIIVGVSGGADSICLATVLKKLGYNIIVAHINHNLRGEESLRDENFVREFSKKNGFVFELLSANVQGIASKEKISLEMAGRKVRYEFFNRLSHNYHTQFIAVAHNKNDNAETVLINIIRGASLNGQKGIRPINNNIFRPLLDVSRIQIEKYLSDLSIDYVNDSTNFEDVYTRNIIRNDVIKTIEKINPNFINTLSDNSNLMCDDNDFIKECVLDKSKTLIKESNNEITLDLSSDEIHIALKRRLVLKCIEMLNSNVIGISSSHIESILSLDTGKKFILGDNLTVTNNYGKLSFVTLDENIEFDYVLHLGNSIKITEINKTFNASFTDVFEKESNAMYIDFDKIKSDVRLRSKKDGDKFKPIGLNGVQSVKKYFINNKIPKYEREKTPIVVCDEDIIGIFPNRINEKYAVSSFTKRILKITEE